MVLAGLQKLTLIDFPGHIACTVFTYGCNFRCPFCHNPELVTEPLKPESRWEEDDFFGFLKSRQGKLEGVCITGGEPTMHPDLPEFISQIKKLGFKVKLDSNGTNPDMLKKLISQKLVDYIAMDVKGPLKDYKKSIGIATDIDKIMASIKLIKESSVDFEFRTTVVKELHSLSDLQQIGEELKGSKKYYLQKFIAKETLDPKFSEATTYNDKEFEQIINKLKNKIKKVGVR